jgi:hypothetical protein
MKGLYSHMSSITVLPASPQEGDPQKSTLPIAGKATEPERDEQEIQQRLEELKNIVALNLSHGFTQMPDEVRRDPTLSRSAKIVYEQLLSYMWRKDCCWPSQETIADDIGTISRRTVIRALNELYERCYIEKYRRGLGKTNLYFVNPLPFVRSFKTPGRGAGHLLTVGSQEHRAHVSSSPQPDVTISYIAQCQNDISRSDKTAHQEAPKCHTNYTKSEEIHQNNRYSNYSTSEEGTAIAPTTIRKEQESIKPNGKGTNTYQPNSTNTSKTNFIPNHQEQAAAARAKAVETAKDEQQESARAAAIAASTGIPAAHLKALGVAQEPQRRPIPNFIAQIMTDYSRDLGDSKRSVKSNITRATKYYYLMYDYCEPAFREAPEEHFTKLLAEAKGDAYHCNNIQHRNGNTPNRIPAFFGCLDNRLNLTSEERAYLRSDAPLCYPEPSAS